MKTHHVSHAAMRAGEFRNVIALIRGGIRYRMWFQLACIYLRLYSVAYR